MAGTLEWLARKLNGAIKRTAASLGLAAALSASQPEQAHGDVYFTTEPKNGLGAPQHIWDQFQVGNQLKLYVFADNTTEQNPTAMVEFQITAPTCVDYEGAYVMDPYISHYRDLVFKPSPERDFFYPFPLEPATNYVRRSGSKRSIVIPPPTGSSLPLQGVKQKKGLVGMISYVFNQNLRPGDYQFEISGGARTSNGSLQASKGSTMTLRVVPVGVPPAAPVPVQPVNAKDSPVRESKSPSLYFSALSSRVVHYLLYIEIVLYGF